MDVSKPLRLVVATVRRAFGAMRPVLAALVGRRRRRRRETVSANVWRRLYVFGAVPRATYERELGRTRRRWKKKRTARPG